MFESNNNLLTLNAGSLKYVQNRQYEILVSTIYLNTEYYQKVRINIMNMEKLPKALIEYYFLFFLRKNYLKKAIFIKLVKIKMQIPLKMHTLF